MNLRLNDACAIRRASNRKEAMARAMTAFRRPEGSGSGLRIGSVAGKSLSCCWIRSQYKQGGKSRCQVSGLRCQERLKTRCQASGFRTGLDIKSTESASRNLRIRHWMPSKNTCRAIRKSMRITPVRRMSSKVGQGTFETTKTCSGLPIFSLRSRARRQVDAS